MNIGKKKKLILTKLSLCRFLSAYGKALMVFFGTLDRHRRDIMSLSHSLMLMFTSKEIVVGAKSKV